MNIEYGYLELLKELYQKSNEAIRDDRTGTGTYSVFGRNLRHNMQLGFPLLTSKKMAFGNIKSELLWFLNGQTDLRTLFEQKNYIWLGDGYKRYLKFVEEGGTPFTKEQFKEAILKDDMFNMLFGSLGPVYGKQWRNVDSDTGNIDQLKDLIDSLKNDPYSRRQLVDSWNVSEIQHMTLPPCHVLYQCYVEDMSKQEQKKYPGYTKKLSLLWYQRSVDTFLGLPFNIASYALLLMILSKITGYLPWELIFSSGDTHIYSDHIESAKIQLNNTPFDLPKIEFGEDIDFTDLDSFLKTYNPKDTRTSIQLDGYFSHSKIEANLSN